MAPGSPSSGRVRGFLKRVTHSAKKVFKPSDQAPTSHTSSPTPPVNPSSSQEPDASLLPHLATRSQQSATALQPVPSLQPTYSSLFLAADGNQSDYAESSLALTTKKVGADAWSGLKLALQLLKESLDILPHVKSAVAELVGVVDFLEASDIILHSLA